MAQNRADKLTGSMDLLDDVLYRIKQAESNEMVCNLSLCFRVCTGLKSTCTLESCKFKVLVTRGLFRIILISNYREVDININNPPKRFLSVFSIKHKFWGAYKKLLMETVLLCTQNICYYRQLLK